MGKYGRNFRERRETVAPVSLSLLEGLHVKEEYSSLGRLTSQTLRERFTRQGLQRGQLRRKARTLTQLLVERRAPKGHVPGGRGKEEEAANQNPAAGLKGGTSYT